jgi:hypothetical protein
MTTATTATLTRNLSIRLTTELYEQMISRPEVNWSQLARAAFQAFLDKQLVLAMTPEGPVLRPAPGETEPRTEKRKKQ